MPRRDHGLILTFAHRARRVALLAALAMALLLLDRRIRESQRAANRADHVRQEALIGMQVRVIVPVLRIEPQPGRHRQHDHQQQREQRIRPADAGASATRRGLVQHHAHPAHLGLGGRNLRHDRRLVFRERLPIRIVVKWVFQRSEMVRQNVIPTRM